MLRKTAIVLGALALTACASPFNPFGEPPAAQTGVIKLIELVPGSIGLQLFGRDCAGNARIVFEDKAGKLHTAVHERKPFCHVAPGTPVTYRALSDRYVVEPPSPAPAGK